MTSINNFQSPPFFHNFLFLVKSKMLANMAAILDESQAPSSAPAHNTYLFF